MKLLRLWLLVVLAVLLPVRGTMAAAMLCAPASPAAHAEAAAHDHGAQAHAHADHGAGRHDGHDQSTQDRCSVCSACCSSPPLPSTSLGIREPAASTSVSYPNLCAPPPTFLSGGQERPPRTS